MNTSVYSASGGNSKPQIFKVGRDFKSLLVLLLFLFLPPPNAEIPPPASLTTGTPVLGMLLEMGAQSLELNRETATCIKKQIQMKYQSVSWTGLKLGG